MTEYIYDTSRVETQPEQGFTGETVVRFRDCKHHEYWEFRDGRTAHDCARGGDYLFDTDPDGFCSRGERREP